MTKYKTQQESFWAGEFGDQYTDRNSGEALMTSNIALFSQIFSRLQSIQSFMEFGANRGLNMLALKQLLPDLEISALEINEQAASHLQKIEGLKVYQGSILEFSIDYQRDLVLSKGLLIHINPELLPQAYKVLYETSRRYICVAEYYNPTPVEVLYRGNKERLFKRDFAGEMMDIYKDLQLLDYGFVYHRDNHFPQDDCNWFVLEKR